MLVSNVDLCYLYLVVADCRRRIHASGLRKSASILHDGLQHQCRLEEMAAPYYILKKKAFLLSQSTFSSPHACFFGFCCCISSKLPLPKIV